MPSKRPSPYAAMDDARLRASPPPSSKRPSRPRPRSGDRRRPASPNPNPSSRYRAAPPSRKSERKRKPRTFADTDPLALALAIAAPASYSVGRAAAGGAHSGGRSGGPGYGGAVQKLWADADEIALLNGAIAFRARYGEAPRLPDMGAFFDSIRDTLSPTIDQSKVYYKLKRLKSKFSNSAPASTSGPHERRVHDLSADLWGADLPRRAENDARSDDADDDEEEDADEGYVGGDAGMQGSAGLPVASELLGEYWSRNGRTLSKLSLEKGLALLGEEEGREAEAKWRRQIDAELRLQVHRHELTKEVFGLLIDAVKGLGP